MAHINTRLTKRVEIGATRREEDDIEVVRTDGGNEVRNARWAQPLLAFDVSFPPSLRDNTTFLEVRNAYRATRAGLHSFKFRDWSDYQATDSVFAIGDGTTTVFPLAKSYAFGSETFYRRIYNPVSPIALKADGVTIGGGYSVNYSTGIVTFTVAPLVDVVLSWTGEFDIPVRFEGQLQSTAVATRLEHHETITLQEVRL